MAIVGLLGLSGCVSGADPRAVSSGDLPPIARDYRARIADWATRYYAGPNPLAGARISDPTLIRDGSGRLLWLVCVETPARERPGERRQALAFAPDYMSTPLARNGAVLSPDDCERPLAWHPWTAPKTERPPRPRLRH